MIVTHLGNGIVKFDDALSIDKDYIDGFFERLNLLDVNHGIKNSDGSVTNEGDYTIEKNKVSLSPHRYTNLDLLSLEEDRHFIKSMRDSIHKCVHAYADIFPIVAESIRWVTNGYAIKYEVGNEIGPHSDCSIPYEEDGVTPINTAPMQNVLTCGLMLNDEYEGGAISYRPWAITTKPNAGSILIYPSSYIGCHEVAPILKGTRYAYLMWYGQGPISGSNHNMVIDIVKKNSDQRFVSVGRV